MNNNILKNVSLLTLLLVSLNLSCSTVNSEEYFKRMQEYLKTVESFHQQRSAQDIMNDSNLTTALWRAACANNIVAVTEVLESSNVPRVKLQQALGYMTLHASIGYSPEMLTVLAEKYYAFHQKAPNGIHHFVGDIRYRPAIFALLRERMINDFPNAKSVLEKWEK